MNFNDNRNPPRLIQCIRIFPVKIRVSINFATNIKTYRLAGAYNVSESILIGLKLLQLYASLNNKYVKAEPYNLQSTFAVSTIKLCMTVRAMQVHLIFPLRSMDTQFSALTI